jgi:hypothetical protein
VDAVGFRHVHSEGLQRLDRRRLHAVRVCVCMCMSMLCVRCLALEQQPTIGRTSFVHTNR